MNFKYQLKIHVKRASSFSLPKKKLTSNFAKQGISQETFGLASVSL